MTTDAALIRANPNDSIRQEVADALYLLEHVISSGFLRDDRTVDAAIVETIKVTAARLGVAVDRNGKLLNMEHGPLSSDPTSFSAAQWIQFELAYGRLAVFAAPQTAQTLQDTSATPSTSCWHHLFGHSVAQRFTWWLWGAAAVFAVLVVLTQWTMRSYGPVFDDDQSWQNSGLQLLEILTPYFYGGLGACVYLLRSAHQHIYLRTFDVYRRAEYFNRILLGTVSGGAIMLFIDHVTSDDGQVVTLSSAALGFLAGYSTDFLFSTIERVISAILPKVGLETVQRRPAVQTTSITAGDTTLAQLLDLYQKAQTEDDKLLYKSLIDRFKDRM